MDTDDHDRWAQAHGRGSIRAGQDTPMGTRQCSYQEIAHLRPTASPSQNLLWWRCGAVACGAVRVMSGRRCRLCAAYVLPDYRDLGIGRLLVSARIKWALSWRPKVIDAYAYRPALFVALGWVRGRTYKCGTTYVRYYV